MEDVALFFHLLGAFSFIAGTIVAGVAFETARRRKTPAEIALLLGLSRIGVLLVALGTSARARLRPLARPPRRLGLRRRLDRRRTRPAC